METKRLLFHALTQFAGGDLDVGLQNRIVDPVAAVWLGPIRIGLGAKQERLWCVVLVQFLQSETVCSIGSRSMATALECSIRDCRRRYDDRVDAICGGYRVQHY